MILRSALDDLTLYELYQTDNDDSDATPRFRKVPFSYVPKFEETLGEDDNRALLLREIKVGRYTAVYVPGAAPKLILKEESSLPKALSLNAGSFKALTPLHHQGCEHGFGLIDENGLRECQLPANAEFSSGWCVQRMKIGDPPEEVRNVAFDDSKQMYVVATCKDVDFQFPEEDGRKQDQDGELSLKLCLRAGALAGFSSHHEHILLLLSLFVGLRL
jgi:cleavage and polyadenylation specificity factor subunit 1